MRLDTDLRLRLLTAVREVQSLPYVWPCPPDADSARRAGAGSCASKHALLAEELSQIGIDSQPLLITGPLVPAILRDDQDFAAGIQLLEVHECLTVLTPGPGALHWDGLSDMAVAEGEGGLGWSVPRSRLREAKEALRERLYTAGQQETRDETLRKLVARFKSWRPGL